jgi:hypothetical protein
VGPRAGLEDVKKGKLLALLGLELPPLSLSARSKPLYRLSYPGSLQNLNRKEMTPLLFYDVKVYTFMLLTYLSQCNSFVYVFLHQTMSHS